MEHNKKFTNDWTQYCDANWDRIDDDSFRNWDREWDDFWAEVEGYAEHHGLTTRHVEEEWILDGEFIPVEATYFHELDDPGDYPERSSTE